jgi:PAS domain S-box-containing protein
MSQIKFNYTTGNLKMKMPNTLGWFEQWKTYYFILEGYHLYRHVNVTESTPNASYNIKDAKVVDFDKFSNKSNSFAIFLSDGKTICFIAENNFDRERWKSAVDYTNVKTSINTIQESILDACISCDINGDILHLNERAALLFGWEKQELIGQNVKVLMSTNKRSMHDRYMNTYKETGKRKLIGAPRRVIAMHKNGQEFPIEISLGEIPLLVGGDVRFIALFRHIRSDSVPMDDDVAIISKPQDPITSSEFTKMLVETSIKDCFRQIEITISEEMDPQVVERIKKIISESQNKLRSGVVGCFLDLQTKDPCMIVT